MSVDRNVFTMIMKDVNNNQDAGMPTFATVGFDHAHWAASSISGQSL